MYGLSWKAGFPQGSMVGAWAPKAGLLWYLKAQVSTIYLHGPLEFCVEVNSQKFRGSGVWTRLKGIGLKGIWEIRIQGNLSFEGL